jgi:F-type H+-transporting ATPase subunit b
MNNLRPTAVSMLLLMLVLLLSPFAVRAQAQGKDAGGREGTPLAQSPRAQKTIVDEEAAYRNSPVVKKLGAMMGMSTERAATVFNVFNFVVLAVLVGFFLLKTLPKTFRDRTSSIQRRLVDARTATEEASARMNSIEERLASLDGQIDAMRTQSEKDSTADEARLKAVVEEERTKILASADVEISAATSQAHRQLQQFAAELAIEQAAHKLVISAETDRLLVQGFARRLAGDNTKGGEN